MAKIASLNILIDGSSPAANDYLAELSGVVIENIQKNTLSYKLKESGAER